MRTNWKKSKTHWKKSNRVRDRVRDRVRVRYISKQPAKEIRGWYYLITNIKIVLFHGN